MAELPSMDQILKDGARRQSRTEIVLGVILLVFGLAFAIGMHSLWERGKIPTFGAIGFGAGLLIRGLFRGRR